LGARASAIGETLELSYPVGQFLNDDHERIELTFFVRTWAAANADIEAEVLA